MTDSQQLNSSEPLDALIVGAGFGGLCAAIKLKARGARFVVVEKESDLGGTWLVNRYPGCGCDVASHLYSYSFALNPDWSRSFSDSVEIWRYLKSVAERYALRPHLRFNTQVQSLTFDAGQNVWRGDLGHGEHVVARTVVLATGALSRPALPDVAGLDTFSGRVFHSQQWDHDYPLEGKRVAVIGTGASAVQFVPHVAQRAASLTLYQRTPPWILPKPDRAIGRMERAILTRLTWLQKLRRGAIYTGNELRVIAFVRVPALLRLFEWVARRHIRRAIKDPVLVEQVTPDYRIGCKRVLISNDYYPALARDTVSVVPHAVASVTHNGVTAADGVHRECDALILGTGFNVTNPFAPGFVTGLDGRDLAEEWQDGPQAYLGTMVSGYPNLFMLAGPNTALGHNSMIYMIESQMNLILSVFDRLQRGTPRMNVRPDVQDAYNDGLQRVLVNTVWNTGGCTNWYRHANGRNVSIWPDFTWRFRRRTRDAHSDDFEPAAAP